MNREEALNLVKSNVKNKNLIKHMLACEVCMKTMAEHFSEDKEKWGLAGLLHDLDYDKTYENFERHGYLTLEMLKEYNISEDILNAILAHPGHKERETLFEKALYAVDPLTGLIVAAVLMHPDKKINAVDSEFILRRFNERRFAAGADREQIRSIEETGLSLNEFIELCLSAMQSISENLGL